MSNTDNNYSVYAHVNKINGKIYIGITKDIKSRWVANGKNYKNCNRFWNAISKYGWHNFLHIVLIENISQDMACIFEKELIKKYNTKKYGYNIKDGGSIGGCTPPENRSLPVYQYDLDGNFIKKWNTLSEAKKKYGKSIYPNHENRSFYGFLWSYTDYETMLPYTPQNSKLNNPIYQYDYDGNFIKRWNSQKDAIEKFGLTIRQSANGYHVLGSGYRWSYDYVDKMPEIKDRHKKSVDMHKKVPRIFQYDIKKNLIAVHDKWWEIDIDGIENARIYEACVSRKKTHYHKGFVWIFENEVEKLDEIFDVYYSFHKPIIQYDLNGNFVHMYYSYQEIRDNGFGSIRNACGAKAKNNVAYGYQWRFYDEAAPKKLENYIDKTPKKIIQKSLNGDYIATYDRASDAAMKYSESGRIGKANILNACRGKRKSAYGYLWEFAEGG